MYGSLQTNNFLMYNKYNFLFVLQFYVLSDTIFILFVSLQTLEKHSRKDKKKTQHDEVEEIAHFLLVTFIFTFKQFLTCCLLKYGFLFCF